MANRAKKSQGKPATFNFLGFTHRCAKRWKDGRFTVIRSTIAKRMGAKLQQIGNALMERRSQPLAEQGKWLASVVRGWLAYYAVPGNLFAIRSFRQRVVAAWRRTLRSRSQTAKRATSWDVMRNIADCFIP